MKRVIIGCCTLIVGAFSCISILITIALNLVSGWSTPPGRYICTLIDLGLIIPLIISIILFCTGVIILIKEY